MKTPREILLARHRHIEPKLDALRRQALTTLSQPRAAVSPASPGRLAAGGSGIWRSVLMLVRQTRWHLAGMSALWLVAAWLGTLNDSPAEMASEAKPGVPMPERVIASLRENRRQVSELLNTTPADAKPPAAPSALPPGRRSEGRGTRPLVAALV
jgi:uncharacterized protein YjiS (DUF1127 family)